MPVPSVLLECLTTTDPPCKTSTSVALSNLNLTNWSDIGSATRLVTSCGKAVLPTVTAVIVDGSMLGFLRALKLNTLTS